jgi:hypothetical protein
VLYKLKMNANETGLAAFVRTTYPQWVSEHTTPSTGYEELRAKGITLLHRDMPLLVLFSLLRGIIEGKPPSREVNFQFSMPPLFADQLVWVAPIRTKPRRTYDEFGLQFTPEGTHTPYLIRKLFNSRQQAGRFRKVLRSIGASSGLFESVTIRAFGRGETAPFELDVVLDGKALSLQNVGYGVSQSLPVIVEILAREKDHWFAIQQPEVHLHPKAQAALGDLFFDVCLREDKRFLIETHSDFTIDRFRLNYRRKRGRKPKAQVLFFERKAKRNCVTPIPIGKDGEFPADQPRAYRGFFIKEEMRLLSL